MNPHVQRGCLRPSYGRAKYTLILKKNAETLFKAVHCITISFNIREDINRKKTFSLGHCPNHLTTPPPDPYSGNSVLFFGRQKRRFARMTDFFLMMIVMVAMMIMMIIVVILMIIMTKMIKKHTMTVKFE